MWRASGGQTKRLPGSNYGHGCCKSSVLQSCCLLKHFLPIGGQKKKIPPACVVCPCVVCPCALCSSCFAVYTILQTLLPNWIHSNPEAQRVFEEAVGHSPPKLDAHTATLYSPRHTASSSLLLSAKRKLSSPCQAVLAPPGPCKHLQMQMGLEHDWVLIGHTISPSCCRAAGATRGVPDVCYSLLHRHGH